MGSSVIADRGSWMQTYKGIDFYPFDPKPEEIDIEDIAHALSLQCRYAGHCRFHYSIAQHSIYVSQCVPKLDALWGLLHDASEAYLVDLPRPIKNFSLLGVEYRVIEANLMACITKRFGLEGEMPLSVKHADERVLATEKRDIMPPCGRDWDLGFAPVKGLHIASWSDMAAESKFMERFRELTAA